MNPARAESLRRGDEVVLAWLRALIEDPGCRLEAVDDDFAAAAARYRLAGLARSCGARHPELSKAELRDFTRAEAVLTGSARVVSGLRAAGVECVTLKGSAMAARFWGDIALRSSSDIDVLVAPPEYEAAQAALVRLGFRREDPFPEWYLRGWHYNLGYVAVDGGSPKVELHWNFARPYLGRPPVASIIASADEVDCGRSKLPAPDPPWQLVAACAHTVFHEIDLRSLVDVAFVARALDHEGWRMAIACARAAGLGPGLYYGVQTSATLLGWQAAEEILALHPGRLRDRVAAPYVARLTPFSSAGLGTRQLGKFATPWVSTAMPRLLWALPFSLTDRPRVLARVDGVFRRDAGPRGGR